MNKLPIVFACDDNYAMPFAVVVESLLQNRNAETFYDVYCLVPESFSEENLKRLNKLKDKHKNFALNFVVAGEELKNTKMVIEHISYVTYFRFLLPELLKDYDRCLYLDVDMIIKHDLTELFQTDLTECYIGAVKHPLLVHRTEIGKYKISDNSYFNAGMLLMNLDLMRKDNLQPKMIEMIAEQLPIQDQDILNVVCNGKVKHISLKYNMMIKLCEPIEKQKSKVIYGKEFFKSKKNPVIIHYANKEKPWDYNNLYFSKDWDKSYNLSVFSDISLNQKKVCYLNKNIKAIIYNLKQFLLRFKLVVILNELRKR